ncbi:hypothetical protein BT63DRAFT_439891 [Microthyrium microscopicum]|uniref:Fork-head domain-containing protein n=1 Tax=Microthyrium microscopicum TaxID=703497 RepID=A0A6A6UAG3_9PEZI|nr:hypothetical protein BT63DRAFT_439891 [Microthyrium microscopicum]
MTGHGVLEGAFTALKAKGLATNKDRAGNTRCILYTQDTLEKEQPRKLALGKASVLTTHAFTIHAIGLPVPDFYAWSTALDARRAPSFKSTLTPAPSTPVLSRLTSRPTSTRRVSTRIRAQKVFDYTSWFLGKTFIMSPTRRVTQSFDIYQDPLPVSTQLDHSVAYETSPINYQFPPNPLSELSHNQHGSYSTSSGRSPTKKIWRHMPSSILPNAKISLRNIVIPPPEASSFVTDSPQKKLLPQSMSNHVMPKSLEDISMYPFPQFTQFDKENVYRVGNESHQGTLKRKLSASSAIAAPLGEKSTNKKQKKIQHSQEKTTEEPVAIPDPGNWPDIEDDGNKPALSYSQLIAAAIMRSSSRKLTLAQIYKWIQDSYSFYRAPETGWQNSIRHNLSLNKAFVKIIRPKDDPGKGNYWGVVPGHEATFLKEKPKPASTYGSSMPHPNHNKRPSTSQSMSSQLVDSKNVDSAKFPDDELSSDATIPASDPAIHEGIAVDSSLMPPPAKAPRSSPPPGDIHSSPPPAISVREGTPPAAVEFAIPKTLSGANRKRKRTIGGMGDSGYYSSIESSASRNPRPFLTSDADNEHPMRVMGRAEEEIARIRSSSYDSPSKPRQSNGGISSSPFRNGVSHKAPLTPGLFKKPGKPPMSVSPNTSLNEHRKNLKGLLGSPDRNLGVMPSPGHHAFNVSWAPISPPTPKTISDWMQPAPPAMEADLDFGTFFSFDEHGFASPTRSSPLRARTNSQAERNSKRPRLERANTTANILANITSSKINSIPELGPAPTLSPTKGLRSPPRLFSPSKRLSTVEEETLFNTPKFLKKTLLEATTKDDNGFDDISFALNLPSDDSENGVDITQGFQRIGAAAAAPVAALQQNIQHLAPPHWDYPAPMPSPTRPSRQSRPNQGNFIRRSTTMF